MNKFIEILKEKGIDKDMQDSVDRVTSFFHGNASQAVIDKSVKQIIEISIGRDDVLKEAFCEYSYENGINAVIKELDIKYNPDSNAAHLSEVDKCRLKLSVLEVLKWIVK